MTPTLYYGDCLDVLRDLAAEHPQGIADLIYLDPPFNSKRDYSVLFSTPKGHKSDAQITAFEDTWHWGEQAEREFSEIQQSGNTDVADMMRALRSFLGENDMMAYLTMMANRLLVMHQVLKSTGSLYLHCDPTASHYLKIVLDGVFGFTSYRNEITWLRSRNPKGSQHESKRYSPDTDSILFYGKSQNSQLHYHRIKIPLSIEEIEKKYDRKDDLGAFTDGPILRSPSMGDRPNLVYTYMGYTPGAYGWRVSLDKLKEIDRRGDLGWSSNKKPYRKLRPCDDTGNPIGNCWTDISSINPQADERLGYPTQKPLALLERIIVASSNDGEIVLDPFCGCGTAVHAAHKLGRNWIGIDITHLAIALIEKRMKDAFPGIVFDVHGVPKDTDGARDLAHRDKYQFQWWALTLVGAQPYQGKKKGADGGIDGVIYFQDDAGASKRVLVSVKGGDNVNVAMIRDLKGVLEREREQIALFVTLAEPTRPMIVEAAAAGFYQSPFHGQFPRIQILTIDALLKGTAYPRYPDMSGGQTFKKAKREAKGGEQEGLF